MGHRRVEPELVDFLFFMWGCGLQGYARHENQNFPSCESKSKRKDDPGHCSPIDCPLCYAPGWAELKKIDGDLFFEAILDVGSLKGMAPEEAAAEILANEENYDDPEACGCTQVVQEYEVI